MLTWICACTLSRLKQDKTDQTKRHPSHRFVSRLVLGLSIELTCWNLVKNNLTSVQISVYRQPRHLLAAAGWPSHTEMCTIYQVRKKKYIRNKSCLYKGLAPRHTLLSSRTLTKRLRQRQKSTSWLLFCTCSFTLPARLLTNTCAVTEAIFTPFGKLMFLPVRTRWVIFDNRKFETANLEL